MPRYKFGLTKDGIPPEQVSEWHASDVAAMQAAADITSELIRNRDDNTPSPLLMAVRVKQ